MHVLTSPQRLARPATNRPVSVCFIIDRLSRAGTETQLLALLRHLDRSRVRPSLCLLNGTSAECQSLLPVNCPVLDLRLRRLASLATPTAVARLAAFWRRHRVEVVQTYFLDSTYLGVPLARLCGVRRVVRVRNNAGYWLTPGHRRLGRLMGRLADVTLTNSGDARRSVLSTERLPDARVRVIENGVDLDRFPSVRPPDTCGSVVRIGAVANLRPVKNIDGLIRVATDICRNDHRIQFEVAGEGEQRTALEAQIGANGLSSQFMLRGSVDDIPAFLGGLDVAVLPSHSESMSNALLEYMAAGRAIVATDVGSNARLVRHGREGLVVRPADDRALADAVRQLVDHPELARTLGTAARRRAESCFSRAAMVPQFEAFYESLSMKRPAG